MTDKKIAIIGLGYVGLPLAIEFETGRASCRERVSTSV